MSNATLNPFSLLQRSFEVVGPIYGTLLILASPGFIIPVVAELLPIAGPLLNLAYFIIVAPILAGAALWLVDQHLQRQTPLLGNSLERAVSKAVPLVFGSFLAGLLSAFASIFFVIPGIYVGVKLAFTPCAIALENQGGTEGLGYSWNLVKGRWWGVFWAFLVMGVILGFLAGAGAAVGGFVLGSSVVGNAVATAVVPIFNTYLVLLFRSLQQLQGQAAYQ